MRKLIAGVAAIAMVASIAQADPGKDKGKDRGQDRSAQVDKKGKSAKKADRRPEKKAETRRSPKRESVRADSKDRRVDRKRSERTVERRVERRSDERRFDSRDRDDRDGRRADSKRDKKSYDRDYRKADKEYRKAEKNRDQKRYARYDRSDRRDGYRYYDHRRLVSGCPPGLKKKRNGCTPPGLDKKNYRDRDRYRSARYYRPDFFGLTSLDRGRYFYDDGYLLQVGNNNRISGYIPLLGGALTIGNQWPSYYQPVQVPDYYENYYDLGPSQSYRYADEVIYRVDPQTSAITSIAALLTGDDFAIGQTVPSGYDVYNVPYGYREQYYDRPDAQYRYSDGYVYQIDPKTRLVAAAIELLI